MSTYYVNLQNQAIRLFFPRQDMVAVFSRAGRYGGENL